MTARPQKNSGTQKPLTVMLKPVGSRCNMRCRYCYYIDRGRFSAHTEQGVMSEVLLEKIIRQTIESSPGPVVSFVWHGGEPTLAGIDFYEKAVSIERKYLPRGWEVWNNLQTNGLLIDSDWCDFLARNRFDVGVSIDGDRESHDENRKDLLGQGTYERAAASIELLMKAGVRPDLLCTVNAVTMKSPSKVYRALSGFHTGWIELIPVVIEKEAQSLLKDPSLSSGSDGRNLVSPPDPPRGFLSVTPSGYGRFLTEIFDLWLSDDDTDTKVQLFEETIRIMNGGTASVCHMAHSCGRVLIAEEDASIYTCDHFVDDEHRLGVLTSGRLNRMLKSAPEKSFENLKQDTLTDYCSRCRFLRFCYGGCPKDRFHTAPDGEQGHYYLCEGLMSYFEHASRLLLRRSGKKNPKVFS